MNKVRFNRDTPDAGWLRAAASANFVIPAAATALAVLCYGVLIPSLGFYWDDLAYQYSLHVTGPGGFAAFVSNDRPFSHYLYVITSSLFGSQPVFYQALNLLLRVFTALSAWWTANRIWPGKERMFAWLPLLMVVYPGFSQQPVTFIYNLHWLNYALTLLSLGLMILAIDRPDRRRLYTLAALVLATSFFSLEYYFGLELLRPVLLWYRSGLGLPVRDRLRRTAAWYAPYFALAAVYVVWSQVIFNNQRYQSFLFEQGGENALAAALPLLPRILSDLAITGIAPWLRLFEPFYAFEADSLSQALFWIVALLAGAGLALYAVWQGRRADSTAIPNGMPAGAPRPGSGQVAFTGLLAMIFGGATLWSAGLHPSLNFPFDRLTLPFIFGACLLLVGLADLLLKPGRARSAVLIVLLALAAGDQFQTTNSYRREWSNLEDFLDQMALRIPGVAPGTALLTHDLPFTYYSDNSLTGIMSIAYSSARTGREEMPLMLFYLNDRLGQSIPSVEPGESIEKYYRSYIFRGSTGQAILFYYSPPGCLRVFDQERPEELPDLPPVYRDSFDLASLQPIQAESEFHFRPLRWFGAPDLNGWCAFYEQADLARQQSDWQKVAALGDEATAAGLSPSELTEWGVFIEGYLRAGRLEDAARLSQIALGMQVAGGPPVGQQMVCGGWQRLEDEGVIAEPDWQDLQQAAACPAPEN